MHPYFWYPEGAADMDPLGATSSGFHSPAFFRTQMAFGKDAQRTGTTKPAALRNLQYTVTRLWGDTLLYNSYVLTHAFRYSQTHTPDAHRCCICHRTPFHCRPRRQGTDRRHTPRPHRTRCQAPPPFPWRGSCCHSNGAQTPPLPAPLSAHPEVACLQTNQLASHDICFNSVKECIMSKMKTHPSCWTPR